MNPRVGNPGLKLANTFGVKSLSRLFVQSRSGMILAKVAGEGARGPSERDPILRLAMRQLDRKSTALA